MDLSDQPDVVLRVAAQTALIDALAPASPSSWNGAVDVTTILRDIAGKMNVPFEPNGVSVLLHNPYLYGSLRDQIQQAVVAARLSWNGLEDGTLAIWLPGQARQGTAPLVSASTGLVSYSAYQSNGIQFRTIFNPAIGFGKKVNVQSSQLLQKQNVINSAGQPTGAITVGGSGTWEVTMMNHRLETLVPHGDWFTDIQAVPVGYVVAP